MVPELVRWYPVGIVNVIPGFMLRKSGFITTKDVLFIGYPSVERFVFADTVPSRPMFQVFVRVPLPEYVAVGKICLKSPLLVMVPELVIVPWLVMVPPRLLMMVPLMMIISLLIY